MEIPDFRLSGQGFKGDPPLGWLIKKADEVCTKITDGTHDTPRPVEKGVPFITAIHVKNGIIDFSSCLYLDQEVHSTIYARCNPEKGDLAVVNIGAGVSECGFIDVEFEFSMKNVALLKPDHSQILPAFLLQQHLLRKDRIAHAVKSGGAQPFLSLKNLRRLPIVVPPLAEQQRIAEILGTWDRAIAATEALIAKSEAQKKALMQQLLTGKRRLPGFYGEWREIALNNLGDVTSGGTPKSSKPEYWDGTIPWLTPTDVTSLKSDIVDATPRMITMSGVESSSAKLLPVGSLLVCTRATIGAMAINTVPMATNQGFKNITPNSDCDIQFLLLLLKQKKNDLLRLGCGSTFLEISKSDFSKLELNVPPVEEQVAVRIVIDNAEQQRISLAAKLQTLKTEKAALMQQLLTGKRRVKLTEVVA